MAFDAGSIIGKMSMDISGWSRGFMQATSIAQIFPATVSNFIANPLLGLIGLAKDAGSAFTSAFSEIASSADNAGEAAEKVGVSVGFLTGVGAVAKDAGASMQSL